MFRRKICLKNITSIIILTSALYYCNSSPTSESINQIRIPLNNEKGVPYYEAGIDPAVDGFDVDEQGNFYFFGGDSENVLCCFAKDKEIYRKELSNINPGPIDIRDGFLRIFDNKFGNNNLFILNKSNGDIVKEYKHITDNIVNSSVLMDTSLILMVFNNGASINIKTETAFVSYDLKGMIQSKATNRFNLPSELYPPEFEKSAVEFLGNWKGYYVFDDMNIDNKTYVFSLKNKSGKIIGSKSINYTIFGDSFYENPIEHRKLVNDTLYFLGHDKGTAIITKVPMKYLFDSK